MKTVSKVTIVSCIIIAVLATLFLSNSPSKESQIINKPSDGQPQNSSFKIANWNLQIFGVSKSSNSTLMAKYASEIGKYDIIFVQEIRDSSGAAFQKLCSLLPQYDCTVSSRAGQTSSKEQYGIIYRKGIHLLSVNDFNPQYQTEFQRPPVLAVFNITRYNLKIYNIHTDPDKVASELGRLESMVDSSGDTMILGDLNADCSYYNPLKSTDFDSWFWAIKDNEDTTVASTDCAYDRIILNNNAESEFIGFGIDKNVTSDISDHYLVWVEMKAT